VVSIEGANQIIGCCGGIKRVGSAIWFVGCISEKEVGARFDSVHLFGYGRCVHICAKNLLLAR
jgi:hypothetical protein